MTYIRSAHLIKTLAGIALMMTCVTSTAQDMPPAAVEVAEAQIRDIAPTVWVPGTVISKQDSQIASEITGNLLWVAEVGDQVKAGAPLARINDRIWQLQQANDLANVASLTSNLDFLVRQVERSERLAKTNNASQSELERLTMEREMLRQQLRAAEVALERTRYDIERAVIKAPFDGIVVARYHQPGEHINQGEAAVRLTNVNQLEIKAQATLSSFRHVQAGSEVAIKTQAGTHVSHVRSLVPVGDERSRMLELRIAASAEHWLIGEAVKIELPNGESQSSLTVPRDALVLRETQVYVFKVGKDEKAERIEVRTGNGYGSRIAVTGALEAGDLVIVRGAERLREGQALNILKQHVAVEGLAAAS
ncbi:efflux RND transporter periplasmic adaptor subunit [Simiduia litorea]|uniref:efflux RND transporter periplasmic adaptor subunit n=1 Tax=Simiduia litorea TaxID=1435348 RepID=UPI0036F27517